MPDRIIFSKRDMEIYESLGKPKPKSDRIKELLLTLEELRRTLFK